MSAFSGIVDANEVGHEAASQPLVMTKFHMPSADEVLSGLPDISSSLPPRASEHMDLDDQREVLKALENAVERAERTAEPSNSFDLKELHASLEQAEVEARSGRRDTKALESVPDLLQQLWSCSSNLLTQAAEFLANKSRDRECISGQFC